MNYAGIDLHSNNSYLVVVNEKGRRVFEGRLPNDIRQILQPLSQMNPIETVAVESTYNYYWLTDGLQDAGHHVQLANPLALNPYSGLKHRDDRHDAGWLAELLRLKILPTAHLYDRQLRGLRDLLRLRSYWVRRRTGAICSLQGRFARCLGTQMSKSDLLGVGLPSLQDVHQELAVWSQLQVVGALGRQIEILEQTVDSRLMDYPVYRRLHRIAGMGPVLSASIFLETGDLSRFKRVGKYASYSRVVPAREISNHKIKGRGNRRCGNRYLGWAYHEAAHCMNRCHPLLQDYRKRKLAQGLKPRQVWSAMAHKLCRAFFFVMRDAVEFSPARLFA